MFVISKRLKVDGTINKIGFWSGLIAFAATTAYVIVQLLQIMDVFHYPLDEILIYSTSLCIVVPFILEMLALHYAIPEGKKFWSHAALVFSIIYFNVCYRKLRCSVDDSNSDEIKRRWK